MKKYLLSKLRTVFVMLVTIVSVQAQTPDFVTQTITPNGAGFTVPFYYTTTGIRAQHLFPASVFTSVNGIKYVTSVYFAPTSTLAWTFSNLQISLGQPNISTLTTAGYATGVTRVLTKTNYTVSLVKDQWWELKLDVPFAFDPTKPLLIEVNADHAPPGTPSWATQYHSPNNANMYRNFSTFYNATVPSSASNTGVSIMGLGFKSNIQNNATLQKLELPESLCGGTQDLKVRVANLGNNKINSLNVEWDLDGLRQTMYSWSHPIDTLGHPTNPYDTLLTVGSFTIAPYVPRTIKVWTSSPNGVIDAVTSNDTVTVVIGGGLSGSYTVGGVSADFATIGAAVNAINTYGICGPVTFNINASASPYTEQIAIKQIKGASAINTITFNGNGSTIQYNNTLSTSRHVIKLDGADYINFTNLKVVSMNATYGWGIHLMAGANYNTISNCVIDMTATTSTTEANSAGIVATNASDGTDATIIAGNNANYLTITNDTIIGAYAGIVLNGKSATEPNVKNVISGNTIRNFYATGVNILNLDSTLIEGNDIHRMGRAATTTFTGISLRGGNIRSYISKNKIHGTHTIATTQSGAAYGVYLNVCKAPTDSENVIVNNLIYDFNSTTGTIYGFYNVESDGSKYYHNTLVFDRASSTSGVTRGFYQLTLASRIDIRNNIFYITRGGTGAKNCLYFGTATSLIKSDNNILYLNSTAGTNGVGYFNANVVSLTSWRAVNGGVYDLQSRALNPAFTSLATFNLKPTAVSINNMGANLGVITDILGVVRTTNPDPGAIDFIPTATLDASLAMTSPIGLAAAGLNTITVTLTNNLTDPITSAVIEYTDGVTPVSEAFSSLSIAAGASQQISFTTPYNLTATVSIRAYIKTINGVADATQDNDTTVTNSICVGFAGGTYTINSAAPTGGGNYQTFTAAINAMSTCGILGPVIFNVDPASGPYNEQIVIPIINGASAIKTITFNGNNRRIYGTPVSATRSIVKLDGADYVTIDSLEIVSVSATYGWGVHLLNGADHNQITNCTIDMSLVTSTTEANSIGIVIANSNTDPDAAGSASDNNINHNTIIGAYKGVAFNGFTAGPITSVKNRVTNNAIKGFYGQGIALTYCDSTLIERNDISRTTRAAVTTFTGVSLGEGNQNTLVNANKIHDTHTSATTLTGTAYGVYSSANDAPSAYPNIVTNNVIYNFNSTSGAQYGIYNSGSDGIRYYNNTISLDNQNSSAGLAYGIYQTTVAANIIIRNNLINISRSGTAAKNCLYFNTAGSGIISNNNLLYNSSSTGTTGVGFYEATNYPTLTDWKTANGGIYDLQSVSADPLFNSITNQRLLNGSPALGAATPLPNVLTDYTGFVRSTTAPTIGAYEVAGDFTGPAVTILPLSNTSSTTNRTIGGNITITDANGVNTLNHKARVYYKKSSDNNVYVGNTSADNGWKWTSATTASPFNFVVDYSILNGGFVSVTDTIQYFIVAQDLTLSHNVGTGDVILKEDADSVELTNVHFPVSGKFSSYRIVTPISGSYQVGATSTPFHNLSEVAAALRSSEVIGNTLFELMPNYNGSTGEVFPIVFDQISLSSPAHTITFIPHSSVTSTLSTEGYPASDIPLLTIDGGDNMIFDGRPGATGDSTNIRWIIRNKRSAATFSPTILLVNDATHNTFKYLDIQSGNTVAASGTFMFGSSNGVVGNDYNTICNNYIRNRTDSIGIPATSIYSSGSPAATNSNNTIDSNRISNFVTNGISITASGNGDSWNIRDNHFYYDNATTPVATGTQTGINILAGGGSMGNYKITGNFIGGSTINCAGTSWKNSGNNIFAGISLSTDSILESHINQNTIANIAKTGTGASGFIGIRFERGKVKITNNVIGRAATADSITCTGTSYMYGIIVDNDLGTSDTVDVNGNAISYLSSFGVAVNSRVRGITIGFNEDVKPVTRVNNNIVHHLSTTGSATGYNASSLTIVGIHFFQGGYSAAGTEVNNNTVYAISCPKDTAVSSIVAGITVANCRGIMSNNKVWDITNKSKQTTGTTTAVVAGIYNYYVSNFQQFNNMVSINGSGSSDSAQLNGILIAGPGGGTHNVYHNSVNVENTTGNTISSYAIHRGENNLTLGIKPPISFKNNIFKNTISTPGAHYAIGIEDTSTLNTGAVNYNVYKTNNALMLARYGTQTYDLAGWRTRTTYDVNAKNVDVYFADINNADLHLTSTSIGDVNLAGTYITSVTKDFDGETRDLITPYMGADEKPAFPLPVALIQFTASQFNNDVLLNWATATESNSSYFEIERSVNGKSFETIARVKAKGKSGSIVNYRSEDENAFRITGSNTLYYRLRMVDNDGKFDYSKVAIVSMKDKKESTALTVFPNPFNDHTYLTINAEQASTATVSVIDITGKVVINFTESVVEGVSVVALQQSEGLKAGIYFVSVEVNGVKQVAKLLKQ